MTILQAARAHGIHIPTLCDHSAVSPFGACRICLVEAERSPKLLTACTTPIMEGMVVDTNTPRVIEARRAVLELILVRHPLECFSCSGNGRCELQDVAYELGVKDSRFVDPGDFNTAKKLEDANQFYVRDLNKCILCGRCVRVCEEHALYHAIDFQGRGIHTSIQPPVGSPMEESDCVFCGQCVQVCPVGALFEKMAAGQGRPWDLEKVKTVCSYCGVGCELDVNVNSKTGRIANVTTNYSSPTALNKGRSCMKGRFAWQFVHSEDRLTAPLIREGDTFFNQNGRVYTIARSAIRPIAVIMSTSRASYYHNFCDQASLTLPLGIICSILLVLVWSRTRRQYHSPRNMLQRALSCRQLRLHYQPIIDIKNNRCVGAEALLRWPGFDGPVMNPAEFIPLAENEGMIAQVTDYVVDELFYEMGEFLASHPQLYIAINLSASDFHSARLISQISEKAHSYAVCIGQIKIEVTERGFIDVPKTTPVIQAFREAGYEIAIDDFGTGYSNLHNLHALNVDILKIDKTFVDTLTTNNTSHLIAEHIIEMARGLRLKTIAEGVETPEQVSWLYKRGVQFCQGWLFAKAMPAREFMQWLANAPTPISRPQPPRHAEI